MQTIKVAVLILQTLLAVAGRQGMYQSSVSYKLCCSHTTTYRLIRQIGASLRDHMRPNFGAVAVGRLNLDWRGEVA